MISSAHSKNALSHAAEGMQALKIAGSIQPECTQLPSDLEEEHPLPRGVRTSRASERVRRLCTNRHRICDRNALNY